MSVASVLDSVESFGCQRVCVTGGEPLAQPECVLLLTALCEAGHEVSLETSGAMSIADIDNRVSRVMDIKCPDSGESHRNLWSNIDLRTPHDQIKFVIASRADYEWARFKMDELSLIQAAGEVLFSPTHGQLFRCLGPGGKDEAHLGGLHVAGGQDPPVLGSPAAGRGEKGGAQDGSS